MSGHRDTHFRFLKHLQEDDYIFVETADGKRKRYIVNQFQVVDANNVSLPVNEAYARISLITCYPFDSIVPGATQRYIASAVEF